MKNKEFLKTKILLPAFLVLATNLISSFVTRFFIIDTRFCDISTFFDKKIPFIPGFIYIYVLAFLQWVICIIGGLIIDYKKTNYYCFGIAAGNIISGIVFIAFPTVMTIRPEYSAIGFTGEIIRFIFGADNPPVNLLPSLHCLHSWGCMRMLFSLDRIPGHLKIINAVFTVLVFLSVLFIKQHLIFDIPAGILAFEAGLFIVRKTGEK